MSRAIQLAKRGRYTCDPNPQVGCVITKGKQIIGEGWHAYAGDKHAEINALNTASDISGSSVYVTLEPCSHHGRTPPCADTLINSSVKEVIVAMSDPNPLVAGKGIQKLEDAGIHVRQGLLEAEAKKLNPGFCKRMEQGLPYVRCKLAMSLDARTALANGESQWISSELSRKDVHRLRAASSAILTGVNTVLNDDPSLTVRDVDFEHKQPLRAILDRELKTPTSARILKQEGRTVIYTQQQDTGQFQQEQVDVVTLPTEHWLKNVFLHLAEHYQVNTVMVEAGSTLSGALLTSGLVDEVVCYVAPKLLGSDAQPLLNFTGIEKLDDAIQMKLVDARQIGPDLRLTYNTRQ
jgi:diaminohydroxyphosphoribosylaminopyrimidine deaminase/5-amino-6-(5-phosphoribosylamino)uracil reductase